MANTHLSIIVPCYNEEQNIPFILNEFNKALTDNNSIELVLVNNGSTDNTNTIIDSEIKKNNYSFVKKVTVQKNIGYGFGILSGLNEANGNVMAWTHADLQTDPQDVIKAFDIYKIESALEHKVFVKGYRKNRKLTETFFSFVMQLVSSIILGTYLSEINAQPKLFPRSLYNLMKNPPLDFSLDLYALYIAKSHDYKIISFPVFFRDRLYGEAKGGGSDIRTKWKLIKRTFKYIIELKSKILKGEI